MDNEDNLLTFVTPYEGPALSLPQLPSSVRPPQHEDVIYPFELLIEFNKDPINNFKKIIQSLGSDPLPQEIAKLLFFSPLSNHAITKLVYSSIFPDTFLYTYISTPIIEFLPFVDSLRTIFSRIALPYKRNHLITLLKTICRVEHERCRYLIFGVSELTHIIASILFFSINFQSDNNCDLQMFTRLVQYNPKLKAVLPKFIQSLYNSIIENPFEISYSFSDPYYEPNLKKSGTLSVPKFSSWNKKSIYAILDNYQLQFYKDESKSKLIGGVPLINVLFKQLNKGDQENTFTILTEDSKPAGFCVESKGPTLLTEPLVIKTNSRKELESWRSSITHYSFIKMFENVLQVQQW